MFSMTFSETIKNDAEQKYLQLLTGAFEIPVPKINIGSYSEYKTKSHTYHQRLNEEAVAVKEALDTIKENKKLRVKEEKAATKTTSSKPVAKENAETATTSSPLKKWLIIGIGGLVLWAIMPKIIKTILIIAAVAAVVVWFVKKKK